MASIENLTGTGVERRQPRNKARTAGATLVCEERSMKQRSDFMALLRSTKLGRLMVRLTRKNPRFAEFLMMVLKIRELRLSEEETDFDMVVDCVANAINKAYQLKLFQDREFNVNVVGAIHRCLCVIDMKINTASSFCSKSFALLTLCQIGWLVMEAKERVGHELRREFISDKVLETCMDVIIESLTADESDWLRGWDGMLFFGGFEALLLKGGEPTMISDLRKIQRGYFKRPAVPKFKVSKAEVTKSKSKCSKDSSESKRMIRNARSRRFDRRAICDHACGR